MVNITNRKNYETKAKTFLKILKEEHVQFSYQNLFILRLKDTKGLSGLSRLFNQIMAKNPKFQYQRSEIKIDQSLDSKYRSVFTER